MYDVIVVGSGIVGATCALTLAKYTPLHIAVLDSRACALEQDAPPRVSAVSPTSKKMLENIDVWPAASSHISAFTKMHVWDATSQGHLDFDCESVRETALGYIVEDFFIKNDLIEQIIKAPSIQYFCPVQPVSLQRTDQGIRLQLDDQSVLSAKLLIGADGAHSWVRKAANIALTSKDYGQQALVATVETTLPHHQTARQRFLSTGPLAFLPLKEEKTCSIVWSAKIEYAEYLMALGEAAFKKELQRQFENRLGEITRATKRYVFPLQRNQAKQYIGEHIVLMGDAAHTIHPLAGQGLNLGLQDVRLLTELIAEAHHKKRDFASASVLRRYERARKTATLKIITIVDTLNYLFSNEKKPIQQFCKMGMNWIHQLPFIKNDIIEYAMGR